MDLRFDDRRVAVTGSSSGIGAAIAVAFAQAGAEVYGLDIADPPSDVSTALRWLTCDVTSGESVAAAVGAMPTGGRPDIVVNAAGVMHKAPLGELDLADWDSLYDVNVKGPLRLSAALLPSIRSTGRGRIVNISSMTAAIGLPTYAAYASSKAALSNYSKVFGAELAESGATVNCVCPGWVSTPMTEGALVKRMMTLHDLSEAEAREFILGYIPNHRFVPPAEIAFAVLFLASEMAQSINGVELKVDGGITSMFSPGVHQVSVQ